MQSRNYIIKAGYKSYNTVVANLVFPFENYPEKRFDGIIADVPCSGSGTWARSPEWLQKNIMDQVADYYVPLQRSIVSNVITSLKNNFPLIYITCSVFKEENEENVEFFLNQFQLKLEKSAYLSGYASGGDTLFAARFVKLQ